MSERQIMAGTELAFENGVEGIPSELWRLVTTREFNGKEVQHVNYFAALSDARDCADRQESMGGKVVSLDLYKRATEEP